MIPNKVRQSPSKDNGEDEDRMFRQAWVDRGYPGHCASASAAPPPLEGFERVYHLSETKYAMTNIEKSRLKVATFADSNDPFELSVYFSRDPHQKRKLREFTEDVSQKYGIVCFSEDWLDPVLWSHYGDRHRGIALGFDVAKDMLLPVNYQQRRSEFPGIPTEDHVDQFLGTKFASWAYEREQRIIVRLADAEQEGSLKFEKFGPAVILREVILGPLCAEDVATVRARVDALYQDVTTFKARLAAKFFSAVPDEPTVPHQNKGGL